MREARADLDAIRRVVAQYAQLLDDGRFEEWSELFTEDAVFASAPGGHLSGADGMASFTGRAAIVEAVAGAQRTMNAAGPVIHFGGHPIIDLEGDSAKAWWDFLVMHLKPEGVEISHAGRYYAELVRRGGRWRFQRRVSVRPGHPRPDGLTPTPSD